MMRCIAVVACSIAIAGCQGSHAPDAARGQQLFTQNCAVCHGPQGQGAEAPAIKGEASRKDLAKLEEWIKKPAPPMPLLYPKPLGDQDVADVAAYVETLK
ncbi:MAG TPA: cytochrome c [Candidatus Nitrosotalea sp.]|nr:cytochrome c [Candidatus Nitrosotalea sp.]